MKKEPDYLLDANWDCYCEHNNIAKPEIWDINKVWIQGEDNGAIHPDEIRHDPSFLETALFAKENQMAIDIAAPSADDKYCLHCIQAWMKGRVTENRATLNDDGTLTIWDGGGEYRRYDNPQAALSHLIGYKKPNPKEPPL